MLFSFVELLNRAAVKLLDARWSSYDQHEEMFHR
jgi:hypothetical protein